MPPGAGWRYRAGVEAFRVVCGHCFGSRGFVVSGSVKFPVRLKINPVAGPKEKTHGFEVDLVGARADGLVLASVKSFFGSGGVVAEHVTGATANVWARKLYRLLNDVTIREKVIAGAAERYGYQQSQVQLRFYVGGFAGPVQGTDKAKVEQWCSEQHAGAGPIPVYGVGDGRGARLAGSHREAVPGQLCAGSDERAPGCRPDHPAAARGHRRRLGTRGARRRAVTDRRRVR